MPHLQGLFDSLLQSKIDQATIMRVCQVCTLHNFEGCASYRIVLEDLLDSLLRMGNWPRIGSFPVRGQLLNNYQFSIHNIILLSCNAHALMHLCYTYKL